MTSGSAGAPWPPPPRFGRRRDLFGLRHDHVDQHHVRVADGFHFGLVGDVANAHALVEHQLADVDLDVLRDVRRQAFDLDLATDELENAALLLHALGLALDRDRHR